MPAEPTALPGIRLTILTAGAAVVVGTALAVWGPSGDDQVWLLLGLGLGPVACSGYWNPWRGLGAVPLCLSIACCTTVAAVVWGWTGPTAALTGAVLAGAIVLIKSARDSVGSPVLPLWCGIPVALAAVAILIWPTQAPHFNSGQADEYRKPYTWAAAVVLGLGALLAWLRLFRPCFELTCEPVLWLMYRVRGAGPGFAAFPTRGPCVVVANHACWLDPLFLAKVLPRPITPMMTSRFYDVPVLRRLMRAFGVIRVPDATFKHDPAEIREAVAALDRGECVVIFPEGFLRRSEEKPLKRFGRGVWQILRERPGTPVFACWIEGAWGSYCSYFNGKPTKNKRVDRRRPIGVGVSVPLIVDAATLEAHLPTRILLMNRVAEARKHLGLPELPAFELPPKGDEEKDDGS